MKKIFKKIAIVSAVLITAAISLGVTGYADDYYSNVDRTFAEWYELTLDLKTKPKAGYENLYDGLDSLRADVQGIIKAYKDDTLVWQKETPWCTLSSAEGAGCISGLATCDDVLYVIAQPTLYAIDLHTGNTIWTAGELTGGNYDFAFDEYGNIYISADFCGLTVVNKYGTIIYRGNSQRWVSALDIEDNAVSIYEGEVGETPLETVDITQFRPHGLSVAIDGELVTFDQPPIIKDNRTLVPLRAIFEALGARVDWNPDTATVTATKDNTTISLTIGSKQLNVNGSVKTLDVPACIVGGRTLVPARAVSESFGCEVGWNAELRRVLITTGLSAKYDINTELLSCLGMTYQEVVAKYGETREMDSWYGGEYHAHGDLESMMNYYTDELHTKKTECRDILATVSELFPNLGKDSISIDELESIFGKCDYSYYYNEEYWDGGPAWYRFDNGKYVITYGGNAETEFDYLYVLKSDKADNTTDQETASNEITAEQQSAILEDFIKNSFEKQLVKMQPDVTAAIANDDGTVFEAYQKTIKYSLIDIDKDNKAELIVSSDPVIENWDAVDEIVWQTADCFSIWDCDNSGNVSCVLAKTGHESRSGFKYFIVEHNGEMYILESSGESNSSGRLRNRNKYIYDGQNITPYEIIYYSEEYSHPEQNVMTVNSVAYSKEYVEALIVSIDEESKFLHSLF